MTTETIADTIPQDVEAEKIVLGAMMDDAAVVDAVARTLHAGDFYRPQHVVIFQAIIRAWLHEQPTDPVALLHQMPAEQVAQIGGAPYLHECVHAVPTTANATYYAGIVAELGAQRRRIEAAARLLDAARKGSERWDRLVEDLAGTRQRVEQVEAEPGERPWPQLKPDALHGIVGEIVELLDPHTEADQAGVLFTLLSYLGIQIGIRPGVKGGNAHHPGKVWPLLTGATSTGAKGSAIEAVDWFMSRVDAMFALNNVESGLSTGEGLIHRVRDETGDDPDDKNYDPGISDKRVVINESEFASVLARIRREGNTLSEVMRQAYDGRPLRTMTRTSPMRATGHHIAIIGQITPTELVTRLSGVDVANGLANRFMPVMVKRSKDLPEGSDPDERLMGSTIERLRRILDDASRVRTLERTTDAKKLWAEVYSYLSRPMPDGPVASMLGRARAHTARLSVIYALLDGADYIDVEHVQAAAAAWQYIEDSILYLFGSIASDPELGKLVEFIDSAESGYVTRSDISNGLFRRNKTAAEIDQLISKLLATGRYEVFTQKGKAGRPKQLIQRKRKAAQGDDEQAAEVTS